MDFVTNSESSSSCNTSTGAKSYNSLPFVSQANQQTGRRVMSLLKPRVSRLGLVVAVLLSCLAFFSFKGLGVHQRLSVRAPNVFGDYRSLSNPLGPRDVWNGLHLTPVRSSSEYKYASSGAYPQRTTFTTSYGFSRTKSTSGARALWGTDWLTSASRVTPRRTTSYNAHRSNTPTYSAPYGISKTSSPFFPSIARAESSCSAVEDFVVERRLATYDCNGGRQCRARVIVSKEGSQVNITAGYLIFKKRGVLPLNAYTKGNVKRVTRREAMKWGKRLLKMIQSSLDEVKCPVTVAMIADAIMDTKDDAARCPNTNHPLCSQLSLVKTCAVAEPSGNTEQQQQCIKFLESPTPVSSLEELKSISPCEDVKFQYNRVSMMAPLCTTTCPSSACPDQERTVFMPFYVQGGYQSTGMSRDDLAACLSSSIVEAYSLLIGQDVPACDNLSYDAIPYGGSGVLLTVSDYHDEPRPAELEVVENCNIMYTFYASELKTVEATINSTCAE